jgi:imidazolonepropionase-like amidohydrolase
MFQAFKTGGMDYVEIPIDLCHTSEVFYSSQSDKLFVATICRSVLNIWEVIQHKKAILTVLLPIFASMNKVLNLLNSAILVFWSAIGIAQTPTPGKLSEKPILILNGEIHTATNTPIANGYVLITKDKISAVGTATQAPKGDFNIIDVKGQKVYPGLILPNTPLGLTEVDAVRATRDFNETGSLNPNARALIAYNPESVIVPTVRSNGVLLAQVTPRGGMIAGTSSVMQLDAWNWEDAAYKTDDGIHINYPASYLRRGWWGEAEGAERNNQREKALNELQSFFAEAKAYALAPSKYEFNPRYEGMKGLFNGTQQLFINSDYEKDIQEAIRWAKSEGIGRIVLVTSSALEMTADFLKAENIPVVVKRIHRLPARAEDDIAQPFNTPKHLHEKGILFCLDYSGDMEAMGSRNLPFLAGTAIGYGLPELAALQAVTLNAAKILGIADRTGSIEVGKDANIIISKGNIFDIKTHHITHAFIQGRAVDLNNRHKQLMRKYSEKLNQAVVE